MLQLVTMHVRERGIVQEHIFPNAMAFLLLKSSNLFEAELTFFVTDFVYYKLFD